MHVQICAKEEKIVWAKEGTLKLTLCETANRSIHIYYVYPCDSPRLKKPNSIQIVKSINEIASQRTTDAINVISEPQTCETTIREKLQTKVEPTGDIVIEVSACYPWQISKLTYRLVRKC